MNEYYLQRAFALKALSDPNRLVIIDCLKDGEQCACKILEQLRISQPTLSHHMRILCQAGLVECRREGKWMHYSLKPDKFQELKELLDSFLTNKEDVKKGTCCN